MTAATRHVAAHLTTATRWTTWRALRGVVRHRGDLYRLFDVETRAVAAASTPAELVARLRETAHSPDRFPGASRVDQLVDVLVHVQDIARPLGRPRTAPIERVLPALECTRDTPFHGSRTPTGRPARARSCAARRGTCCWSPPAASPVWRWSPALRGGRCPGRSVEPCPASRRTPSTRARRPTRPPAR